MNKVNELLNRFYRLWFIHAFDLRHHPELYKTEPFFHIGLHRSPLFQMRYCYNFEKEEFDKNTTIWVRIAKGEKFIFVVAEIENIQEHMPEGSVIFMYRPEGEKAYIIDDTIQENGNIVVGKDIPQLHDPRIRPDAELLDLIYNNRKTIKKMLDPEVKDNIDKYYSLMHDIREYIVSEEYEKYIMEDKYKAPFRKSYNQST